MQISDHKIEEFERAMDSLRRVKMASKDHWLAVLGLTEQQIHIMLSLAEADNHTTTAMAKLLCVSSSAATQTTETLVRRGLVVRAEDPDDRRINRLSLTDEGRQLSNKIATQRHQYFAEMLGRLTPEQVDGMISGFNVLAEIMTQHQTTERN